MTDLKETGQNKIGWDEIIQDEAVQKGTVQDEEIQDETVQNEAGEPLSPEKISFYAGNAVTSRNVYLYSSVTSTNDVAKVMASSIVISNTAVIAETQTARKGRNGRTFYSPPGGIYLSLSLLPDLGENEILLLTTGIAVAAAQAIEETCGLQVQIKWVNDLYLHGKKVAGILAEAHAGCFIAGIGVNMKLGADGFPDDLAEKAGTLMNGGVEISRNRLAGALIGHICRMAAGLEDRTGKYARELLSEARRRSCVLGKDVAVEGYPLVKDGKAVEIDEHGFLIVEDNAGNRHTLNSGEVSLRKADGASW
ncbi:MAG: biotin--[acetyl-CoA-carboxylase] ligase [Peptococcaceae bacterium]|jgi:BirA family biotin operon repressor/biotin-[acetyl-CoA-carboxylase] ligase|nr:biotin--[acetyl-CoA-carboxylase] ligase [Peptococcaceae bacterium]